MFSNKVWNNLFILFYFILFLNVVCWNISEFTFITTNPTNSTNAKQSRSLLFQKVGRMDRVFGQFLDPNKVNICSDFHLFRASFKDFCVFLTMDGDFIFVGKRWFQRNSLENCESDLLLLHIIVLSQERLFRWLDNRKRTSEEWWNYFGMKMI